MLKIMIVDNEASIRKGLIHCIRWEALGCIIAAQAVDGIDALEQVPAVQPAIIISDIRMPGMDGLELARRINEQYPHIKVIILTGFPDFEYAQRAIQYQVVDFVLKPTSIESLTQAIEKAKARIAEEQSNQELERRLASKSEQNLQLERGMLLHDLIHRVDLSNLYVINRIAQLGLNLTRYHVLRLDIAPLYSDVEDGNADLLPYLHQAQEVLCDSIGEYDMYFAPYGGQACYAIVCTADTDTLAARCQETVDVLSSLPQFSLSIGISRFFPIPCAWRMPPIRPIRLCSLPVTPPKRPCSVLISCPRFHRKRCSACSMTCGCLKARLKIKMTGLPTISFYACSPSCGKTSCRSTQCAAYA